MCPNCRQDADLEAPVDVETETWEAILRTTDPRTPTTDQGTSRDPQVKMLSFRPIPDLLPHSINPPENLLVTDMHSLNLGNSGDSRVELSSSPDRDLGLTRTLSPGLPPIIEHDSHRRMTQRDVALMTTPPIGISRRVRALSATRDGFEELASLSATPTIDRGPFVYGDMTVNADGSAEVRTSNGSVVQLPRESMSEETDARGNKC
jgi:hypothetical protein